MSEKVYFSFYRGEPPIPVNVFKERRWVFNENVELCASIIGKSHRIISRTASGSFTEFIAYPERGELFKPIDFFEVNVGDTHQKSYRDGNFFYIVSIETIPLIFQNMADFVRSLEKRDWEILNYDFEKTRAGKGPFTGISVDLSRNVFHTVHTYPEHGYSIVSKSEIHCPLEL